MDGSFFRVRADIIRPRLVTQKIYLHGQFRPKKKECPFLGNPLLIQYPIHTEISRNNYRLASVMISQPLLS